MGPALLPWSTTSHVYTTTLLIGVELRVRQGTCSKRLCGCLWLPMLWQHLPYYLCHYSPWHGHKIKLPHVQQCHLLNYQCQLLQSILLSHCRYSLRIGHAHEILYDLPALEKCILDRFIHGKLTILVDIPQVSYQKDVYTAATFAAVRKKVPPQVITSHGITSPHYSITSC